jgi:hypothetical protein
VSSSAIDPRSQWAENDFVVAEAARKVARNSLALYLSAFDYECRKKGKDRVDGLHTSLYLSGMIFRITAEICDRETLPQLLDRARRLATKHEDSVLT